MNGTHQDNDTIAAIATPLGHGGIGIVKLSGPGAREIRDRLFRPSRPDAPIHSHQLIHGVIVDSDDGRFVDEVLVSWMAGPHSYTGEDVVEINTHGGNVVMRRILELVIGSGARIAEPGEFTKRGFLNGRIDLTQAEAVIDLINAKTARAARIASRHLSGDLRSRVEGVRQTILDAYALLAVSIDFPEERDGDDDHQDTIVSRLQQDGLTPLRALLANHHVGQVLRDGARIAVVGRTNAGKSSLMNRLLDRTRVIVSDAPGTTRDVVSDATSIDGIPVVLVDTAGLRDTQDPVEAAGIQMTREAVASAQLVLFIVAAGEALQPEDAAIFAMLDGLPVILVRNKMDLTDIHHLPDVTGKREDVTAATISAKYGDGIDALKLLMVDMLTQGTGGEDDDAVMPNERQAAQIAQALDALGRAIDILRRQGEDEIAAIEMDSAVTHINSVLGIAATEDILDTVFSRFCIGK